MKNKTEQTRAANTHPRARQMLIPLRGHLSRPRPGAADEGRSATIMKISWTPTQVERYQDLKSRGHNMTWKARAKLCFPDSRLGDPSSSEQLLQAEKAIGRALPPELKALLMEYDGLFDDRGDWLIHTVEYMIADILGLWDIDDLYMHPKGMLLFGGPGDGDRYFIPILPNGGYADSIFLWSHEDDSRDWIADSLRDLFYRASLAIEERYSQDPIE